MLFGPISGRIADFTGPRIPAVFGMIMCSFALYLYTNLTLETTNAMIILITVLEGNINRFIRSKFKVSPSSYIENIWELLSINLFKD